jgi:hypothetical protein
MALSPDGSRFAYAAGRQGGWLVVSDGVEGPLYDTVQGLTYDDTGEHPAYMAIRHDGRAVAVLDGKEGPTHDLVLGDTLTVGPEGRLAYGVERDDRAVMVVDGWEGDSHDWIYKPALGGAHRYAYVALDNGQYRAIVDGEAGPRYDGVSVLPAFSEDGRHVYYAATDNGARFVVFDGHEDRHFRDIVPDSPRFTDRGTFEYLALADDGLYRVTHHLSAPEPEHGPDQTTQP